MRAATVVAKFTDNDTRKKLFWKPCNRQCGTATACAVTVDATCAVAVDATCAATAVAKCTFIKSQTTIPEKLFWKPHNCQCGAATACRKMYIY